MIKNLKYEFSASKWDLTCQNWLRIDKAMMILNLDEKFIDLRPSEINRWYLLIFKEKNEKIFKRSYHNENGMNLKNISHDTIGHQGVHNHQFMKFKLHRHRQYLKIKSGNSKQKCTNKKDTFQHKRLIFFN
jgi:hypothetical protein